VRHCGAIVLVEGQPPIPPEHGEIEWVKDFFRSDFAMDEESGRIDYRKQIDHRFVKAGAVLARVSEPKLGFAGKDVFGKRINVPRPNRVRIRIGANVAKQEKGRYSYYYTKSAGRLRFTDGQLSVDTTYEVKADIVMETGDIEHSGAIVVPGDVQPGFTVSAGGDIEVRGIVDNASIVCGGNLSVRGGITGSAKRSVKVAGGIHARFLLNANIEAGGDVVVENEIVNSTIQTQGAVIMPGGRLIGGETIALGGILVGQLGSESGTPTSVAAGVDYKLQQKIDEKQQKIKEIQAGLEFVQKKIDDFMSRQKQLTHEQREACTELMMKAAEIEEGREEIENEIRELKSESRALANSKILIRDVIYSETTLRIEDAVFRTPAQARGPLHAFIGEDGSIEVKIVRAAKLKL